MSFVSFDNVSAPGSPVPVEEEEAEEEEEVWLLFTGMGAHWSRMGSSLLAHHVFREALRQCQDILFQHDLISISQKDIYLVKILAETDMSEYNSDNLVATVALVSLQIGLVHVLLAAGVRVTHCLGHSVGELAAAYASNSITLEQAVLSAFYRGKALTEAQCPVGSMAATGLTWDEACRRLSGSGLEVWPACHNGLGSTTVSGRPADVEKFVESLKHECVFARLIDSSGCAFHSPMMRDAVGVFRRHLSAVFGESGGPARSSSWIPSSDADSSCPSDTATYFAQNLSTPVRFSEALQIASDGAVVIEVGPHALLRSAVKATKPSVKYLSLQKRGCDPLNELFKQLGCLRAAGLGVRMEKPLVARAAGVASPMLNKLMHAGDHSDGPFYLSGVASTSNQVVSATNNNESEHLPKVQHIIYPATRNIHPSSMVDPSASVHPTAVIGPFTVIGENVFIGAGCVIGAHCSIEGGAHVGAGCELGKCCQIDDGSRVGEKCVLHNSVTITGKSCIGANNAIYSEVSVGECGEWKTAQAPSGPVVIGDHNVIRENTIIHRPYSRAETRIGNGCYFMHNVTISHDVFVGDNVQIAPMCMLAGYVTMLRGCFVGINSSMHQFTTVGAYCMIAMGSRVTRDVPPCVTLADNQCFKINAHGLTRNHGYSDTDVADLEEYYNSEWPLITPSTKTVFMSDFEEFHQVRITTNSGRAIAPMYLAKINHFASHVEVVVDAVSSVPEGLGGDSDSDSDSDCRVELAAAQVAECLRSVLNIPAHRAIPADCDFEVLGVDSLLAVALAERMSQQLGVEISAEDLSVHNTGLTLAAHVLTFRWTGPRPAELSSETSRPCYL